MINIINNIGNVYTRNQQRPVFFGTKIQGDTFTRMTKDNQNLNTDIETFSHKIKGLPFGIAGLMIPIQEYLKGNLTAEQFSGIYTQRMPLLLQRTEFGENAKEFNKEYKTEINLLKDLAANVFSYSEQKGIDEEILRSSSKQLVEKYNSADVKHKKHFLG